MSLYISGLKFHLFQNFHRINNSQIVSQSQPALQKVISIFFVLSGVTRRHREIGRIPMVIQHLRICQLSIRTNVAAVVGVPQLRGHVRLVQVLVDHQRRVHGWRLRGRVHDFSVRIFGSGRHPGGILLNFCHRIHFSMIERFEVTTCRACERSAPARYCAGASVGTAVDSRGQRVVRHRRRTARQTTVRSVLPVGRKCVEVLDLTDERVVHGRTLTRGWTEWRCWRDGRGGLSQVDDARVSRGTWLLLLLLLLLLKLQKLLLSDLLFGEWGQLHVCAAAVWIFLILGSVNNVSRFLVLNRLFYERKINTLKVLKLSSNNI